jgi:hypothetical protein
MIRTLSDLLHAAWVTVTTIRAQLTIWYVLLLGLTLLGFSGFLLFSLSQSETISTPAGVFTNALVTLESSGFDPDDTS